MIARAMSIVEGKTDADAVFIATCFRCAEGALVRNEIRRFIQQNTNLPVVTYSFTERTKADELFIRMEALSTIVARKSLLAREKQEGLTIGIDSGSTTTKVVLMLVITTVSKPFNSSVLFSLSIKAPSTVMDKIFWSVMKGAEALKNVDAIYAEFYTARLFGTNISTLEEMLGVEITILTREQVEEENIPLKEAEKKDVAFVSAGDPLIATTHSDLMDTHTQCLTLSFNLRQWMGCHIISGWYECLFNSHTLCHWCIFVLQDKAAG